MRRPTCVLLALCVAVAVVVSADPVKLSSPLDKLEVLRGRIDVQRHGQTVVMTVFARDEAGDRLFIVETNRGTRLPSSFRTDSAEVQFWMGHLVVVAPRLGKAWHFAMPEIDALPRPALGTARSTPDAAELDAVLGAKYEVTRIDTATAIISRSGPLAFDPPGGLRSLFGQADDQQDPGTGGVGSCGKSCTISCGDGSSCFASCSGVRCASCTCPASCTCS